MPAAVAKYGGPNAWARSIRHHGLGDAAGDELIDPHGREVAGTDEAGDRQRQGVLRDEDSARVRRVAPGDPSRAVVNAAMT